MSRSNISSKGQLRPVADKRNTLQVPSSETRYKNGGQSNKVVYDERDSAVLVKNLCKGYDKRGPRVLNNFSMNVRRGTIYGLLGSSGCGKTTALSCIIGLKKWESGEIRIFGERPGTRECGVPGKRLGYVPQDTALYDQLSIKENIQYYGRLYGMAEGEILDKWALLVSLLQLPSEFKLVCNLSGGQKRRTSLSLALVHSPELLILDEPTVGLDPLLREAVWKYLLQMVKEQGSTIVITTHYIEETRRSHTIGVMRHGHLLVEDCPKVLMAEHKTDLLEDVVLKLCRKDTKETGMKNSPSAGSINNNNSRNNRRSNNGEDSDDSGDSGTGTDNDNTEFGSMRIKGRENSSSIEEDNGSNATTTTSVIVPSDASSNKKVFGPSLRAQKNGDPSGSALFQSKWKQELESVVVAGDSSNVPGKYNQTREFDAASSSSSSTSSDISSLPPTPVPTPYSFLDTQRSISGPKKLLSEMMEISQHVAALAAVIYLSLIRHPVFFIAALILPAIEVLLTISSVGKEPKGLYMGVINDEIPDWTTKCPVPDINITSTFDNITTFDNDTMRMDDRILEDCNFNELSCKFLNLIMKQGVMDLKPFDTIEEAVEEVHQGNLWGYIHFGNNYSQHMIDRLAAKQFAFEETVNGSTISLRMDMSQYLGSIIIIQDVFEGLQQYILQLIAACDLGAEQATIPLEYRTPVYGTLESNYHSYIIPGVLANIMFMMPFVISGIMFITDLKLGTMDRARVAGLTTFELMITYAITQGTVVIGQIIICTVSLKLGFNFEIVGSTLIYIGITFLLGMCGQAFGLVMGILCQDEIVGLIVALFILPTMLLFGGVLWPLDCMAPTWKYFGSTMPTTLITESLRSTALRGNIGLTHILMWPGLAVTGAWLIFFWITALISYRLCIK